jgi:hypothetical protein
VGQVALTKFVEVNSLSPKKVVIANCEGTVKEDGKISSDIGFREPVGIRRVLSKHMSG